MEDNASARVGKRGCLVCHREAPSHSKGCLVIDIGCIDPDLGSRRARGQARRRKSRSQQRPPAAAPWRARPSPGRIRAAKQRCRQRLCASAPAGLAAWPQRPFSVWDVEFRLSAEHTTVESKASQGDKNCI